MGQRKLRIDLGQKINLNLILTCNIHVSVSLSPSSDFHELGQGDKGH